MIQHLQIRYPNVSTWSHFLELDLIDPRGSGSAEPTAPKGATSGAMSSFQAWSDQESFLCTSEQRQHPGNPDAPEELSREFDFF